MAERPLKQDDRDIAARIGTQFEAPRQVLAAIIDILAAERADEHAFRHSVYSRAQERLVDTLPGKHREFERLLRQAFTPAAAEICGLKVEVLLDKDFDGPKGPKN